MVRLRVGEERYFDASCEREWVDSRVRLGLRALGARFGSRTILVALPSLGGGDRHAAHERLKSPTQQLERVGRSVKPGQGRQGCVSRRRRRAIFDGRDTRTASLLIL